MTSLFDDDTPFVFIAHKSESKPIIERTIEALLARDVAVFVDNPQDFPLLQSFVASGQLRGRRAGEHWAVELKLAAEKAAVFSPLIPEEYAGAYFASDPCRGEIETATGKMIWAGLDNRDAILTARRSSPYRLDLGKFDVGQGFTVRRNGAQFGIDVGLYVAAVSELLKDWRKKRRAGLATSPSDLAANRVALAQRHTNGRMVIRKCDLTFVLVPGLDQAAPIYWIQQSARAVGRGVLAAYLAQGNGALRLPTQAELVAALLPRGYLPDQPHPFEIAGERDPTAHWSQEAYPGEDTEQRLMRLVYQTF
jgi:hypothetical protein